MPHYMLTFQFTDKAAGSMIKAPQNYEAQLRKVMDKLGCKLRYFFYSFVGGDFDALSICELSDNVDMSALELATTAAGVFRNVKIRPIFGPGEALEAMQRAGKAG